MPFGQKSRLHGPVWTVAGTADLSAAQHARLDQVLGMCCDLYNALLEAWRGQYRWHQTRHRYDDVQLGDVYDSGRVCGDRGVLHAQLSEMRNTETPTCDGGSLWSDLSFLIGRGVINRFDKARSAFYDRCKQQQQGAKIKVGYPRFKPRSRWRSIVIDDPQPAMVKAPDQTCNRWKLQIKGLPVVKFRPFNETRLTAELAAGGKVSEIRIVRKALRVEVHLVVRTTTPDPPTPEKPVKGLGVDLGIGHRVVCSDGSTHPGVTEDRTQIKKRQRALAGHDHCHRQASTDRYTPGRRRKVEAVGKAHARMSERERHSVHRLVHQIISLCVAQGVDGIAVELLQIKNLIRNGALSDRISQQRWGMFLRLLEVKAARAGIAYAQVDPRHTSLDCSRCQHRKPKHDLPLSVRVYVCERCGLRLDRDVNAAINVLVRAFGDEARWGGASPRSGRHTPTTCGGSETTSVVSDGRSTANSLPARKVPAVELWSATDRPHSIA